MQPSSESSVPSVDYDHPPVAELEVGETQYRLDPGFRGAIAISGRSAGTWSWSLLCEGSWDGVRLKAKALDRQVVASLEKALRAAGESSD